MTVLDEVTPLDTGVTREPMDLTPARLPRAATAADAAKGLAPALARATPTTTTTAASLLAGSDGDATANMTELRRCLVSPLLTWRCRRRSRRHVVTLALGRKLISVISAEWMAVLIGLTRMPMSPPACGGARLRRRRTFDAEGISARGALVR
jgi:hypothetical protein